MSSSKTNENNVSLRERVQRLTILQAKITKAHKTLLALLKGYCYKIDPTNITKKYALEINSDISEIQEKINIALDTTTIIRKLLSHYKKLLDYSKKHIEYDGKVEDLVPSQKDHFIQVVENYNVIDAFIKKHNALLEFIPKVNRELGKELNKDIQPRNSSQYSENTLLISETQNKVILPYTVAQINEYIDKNPDKDLTIQNVIDTVYTLPLTSYKNSVLSRFSEAFKLIRQREHGSVKEALDLAFELAFNYSLHPAIITACSSLNELDIYLACLEYNELDAFKFFDINFEIAPTISKNTQMG